MPANPVTGLEAAIARGLSFLERHQLPSGEFVTHACQGIDMRDRAVYEPTVFTTAIVIRASSRVDDESVWCMTRRAVTNDGQNPGVLNLQRPPVTADRLLYVGLLMRSFSTRRTFCKLTGVLNVFQSDSS